MLHAGLHDLLDRDRELASVHHLLDDAMAGAGGLLLIQGEAGIGKTGLVGAACRAARERELLVLAARGGELEGDLAFGVARELLAPQVRGAESNRRAELFAGAAALAEPVLEASPPPPDDLPAFGILHGLYWFTAGLATAAPVLIVVDDVHWCDLPSLRFLAYLAHRIEGLNVALMLAARPGEWGSGHEILEQITAEPPATVIRPGPLGRDAVASLVAGVLGSAPDAQFGAACMAATGGNPFLVGELLAELHESGVPPVAAEAQRLAAIAPHGVRRAVRARLTRLPDGAAALARAAAVLGDGADARLAAMLAGLPVDRVPELTDLLVAARIFEPRLALTFVHPLVRTAVIGNTGPAEIAAAHHRAAVLLAADGKRGDALVPHLLAADPRGDPWVAEVLRDAATRAAAGGAPEVGARYLLRAMAEPAPASERFGLLLDLGTAEMHVGVDRAVGHLTAAVELADGPIDRARARLRLARTLFLAGRVPESVHLSERAIEELGGNAPELALELEAELAIAATQDVTTRSVAIRRNAQRSVDPKPTSRAGCMMLANLSIEEVITGGSRQRAVDLAERALSDRWLFDDQTVVTLPSAVLSLTLSGCARRAIEVWGEVIDRHRRQGDVRGFALASAFRGYAAGYVGDLDAAVADTDLP